MTFVQRNSSEGRQGRAGFDPRFTLVELGGALGDLGTLLPLAAALITVNHMEATGVFLAVGVAYVAAGLYYRLPIPVQPLKAVSAIAIATGLSPNVVSAAGPVLGIALLLVAVSGVAPFLGKIFPRSVIRGIQLGLGLLLIQTGLRLATGPQLVLSGSDSVVTLGEFSLPMGLPIAGMIGLVLLWRNRPRWLPSTVAALALGLVVALASGAAEGLAQLRFGLVLPSPALPSLGDLGLAAVLLVVPQVPLTLGNSVVATRKTAEDYFGQAARRVSYRGLLTSMALINLGTGLVGGLPVCHGSGGLTAHYRFGARTGGANLMIGAALVALAVLVDGNVVPILALIPFPVLGALLVFTGVQHGLLARDLSGAQDVGTAGAVAVVGFLSGNLALGFAVGLVLQSFLWLNSRFARSTAAA